MGEGFRVVSIADEALDTDAMDRAIGKGVDGWQDYIRSRDISLVRAKPGQRLTEFVIRQIPNSVFGRYVQDGASEQERYRRAFQCGVAEIRNAPKWLDGGGTVRPSFDMPTATTPLKCWSDEALEQEEFPWVWLEEVGSIAWARSFLRRTSGVSFVPPPSLVHVLVEIKSRAVAAAVEAARQSSAERSKASSPSSASASDEATAAPATE